MKFSTARPLHFVFGVSLAAFAFAQPPQLPSQQVLEQQAREQEALEQDAAVDREADPAAVDTRDVIDPAHPRPPSTHATIEASPELSGLASREPWRFIGKQLVLTDGAETKTVGPVFAVRKRKEDQLTYLIVNATEYFNSPTQYAVAMKNVDRMEAGTLITPAAPGMHLLGMQYYAQDYEDIAQPVAVPTSE